MAKSAILHRSPTGRSADSRSKHTESYNVCPATLSNSEYSVLAICAGCGCRFVPSGPQRYCSHECYSGTLRVSIEQRFWTKVNKTSGCWLWTAGTIRGYGQIGINRRPSYAHRVAWELTHGPIPDGASVLHKCDVPLCVRPDHLFLGSQQDNLKDARQKGRLDTTLPRRGKLTYEDRLAIFTAKPYRGVCEQLALAYGVTKACISHIRAGRFARSKTPRLVKRAISPMDRVFVRVPSVELRVMGEVR